MVSMVSLLERFHCTGLFSVAPMVSLLWRFHCRGLFTVVQMVSLLWRFDCTEMYCGPNGVLIMEVSLYRTVY